MRAHTHFAGHGAFEAAGEHIQPPPEESSEQGNLVRARRLPVQRGKLDWSRASVVPRVADVGDVRVPLTNWFSRRWSLLTI
jgi:hypothetical protein